jgi:uncharacterized protein (DUF427 family)
MWEYEGQRRPPFAEEPGPEQESVWDYPRPPLLVRCDREVLVIAGGVELARSSATWRVLETASPPTFYIPRDDVNTDALVSADGVSICEWKGAAQYWALRTAPAADAVAWSYADPLPAFQSIRDAIGFYPGRVDCFVDGEKVRPQPGYFYGGWITDDIVGPVKGEPGTGHW